MSWFPRAMRVAPELDPNACPGPVRPRRVLLIQPFYPKDPHASFGKHVLTPSLALTSIAGATPPDWEVAYWDENLLMGPPPCDPLPQVVGITVHLTFARRAYELADWYRRRGAGVILGGLHVSSCPEEAAFRRGFMNLETLEKVVAKMPNCEYRDYLLEVVEESKQ